MYLRGGWLLLARISPHLNMMDLAVWQNGQLSDRDIQPTLCSHDGWAHANIPRDHRWNPAAPWPVEGSERVRSQKCNHATHIFDRTHAEIETHRNTHRRSSLLIMHNYCMLPNPDIHTLIHLMAEGQPSVLSCLQDHQIECQPRCQRWQLIMSVFTETHVRRCVSYWTKPCFGSANSPRRAQVCFCILPPSMGRGETRRGSYCVRRHGG